MHSQSSSRRRRLVAQPPQEPEYGLSRGGSPTPQRLEDGDGDGDGEDRIGALPDDMLVYLLSRLGCLREAARTSVLSRRWRGLWTHLRVLRFDGVDPDLLEGALALVRPRPHLLCVRAPDERRLSAARVGSLLRSAALVEPANLAVANVVLDSRDQDAAFELPCFERAASMALIIGNLNFTLPPAGGEFASLKKLFLKGDIADLGNLLLRCPSLRYLSLSGHLRTDAVTIRSNTLKMLTLAVDPLVPPPNTSSWVIDIATPNLELFSFLPVHSDKYEFNLSISEPRVENLDYLCIQYEPNAQIGFVGEMWCLYSLNVTSSAVEQLRFHVLNICIFPYLAPPADRSFTQEIARLPVTNFSVLEMDLYTDGHVFGPLMSHLLNILTAIKRLKLVLLDTMAGECSEFCDCDEDSNWRDEPISLLHLEVVKIEGFSMADHELDFLKLLFASAPVLKCLGVKLLPEVSSSDERYQELRSIFDANASVNCFVHDTTDGEEDLSV